MTIPLSPAIQTPRFQATDGIVYAATRAHVEAIPAWRRAFAGQRKDARYYGIVEDTIEGEFDHRYFVVEDRSGQVQAVQPFFLLDQDLLQGVATGKVSAAVQRVRRAFPRFLKLRTLMVGCAAGEGHLDDGSGADAGWVANCLHEVVSRYARTVRASMVVFKEFPASYRAAMTCFSSNGYTRIPSMPMTRLSLAYQDFDDFARQALSKSMRRDLRRKFHKIEAADPIEMTVVSDLGPYVDEAYPLYLQVFNRSHQQFEKLTPEYFRRIGREMPDRARFFIWRQNGRMIAFGMALVHGDTIYDEYLGLDYGVALDLHLYFHTLRDVLEWGMKQGLKWYCSTALDYDPKLRFRCHLRPLDLYVTHTSPVANFVLRRVLPRLGPTNGDPALPKFPNYAELWGN